MVDEHRALYERLAVVESRIDKMETQMTEMHDDIKQLLALANKSKGAMWAYGSLYATLGGAISWLIGHFINKP